MLRIQNGFFSCVVKNVNVALLMIRLQFLSGMDMLAFEMLGVAILGYIMFQKRNGETVNITSNALLFMLNWKIGD